MKKVFSNHSEVAHIWAQQSQEDGRAANIFFEGTRIYSYGKHFCIANFIDPETVLFTTREYSVSTAGHKSLTRQAVSHKRIFEVPSISPDEYTPVDHAENVKYYLDQIQEERGAALRAHSRGRWYLDAAEAYAQHINDYIDHFDLKNKHIDAAGIFTDKERKKIAAKAGAHVKRTEERNAAALLKNAADLELWTGGDQTKGRSFYSLPVKLRVKLPFGEKRAIVETSHGARVTCIEAAAFLQAMDAGADLDGREIGSYTAQGVEDETLIIGCHKIPLAEIDRIRPAISEEVKYAKI